jgi:4a-hydroxytetrahydrobiopterin dehydratase
MGENERPLTEKDALDLLKELPGWRIENGRLLMNYGFGTFMEAVSFLNKIAAIAAEEEHTPDVCIEDYNKMRLSLYTYCCGGLTENDFILAAKIGKAYASQRIERL